MEGITLTSYVCSQGHRFLVEDAARPGGANIGINGQNLTLSFLSLNRSVLSRRLLDSVEKQVPEFAGQILIIDQGSEPDELRQLRARAEAMRVCCEVVELGRNFGVAGGRNRAIRSAKTEWIVCLDNDIYFRANPLPKIQEDLAVLGCHFLNLPLLDRDGLRRFALGGHLYVSIEDGFVHIGAGSACRQEAEDGAVERPFLSTFLFGGACVIKVSSFLEIGGYDEGMFVGFEDIDFSIRLFQQGRKIGNTTAVSLVHDHPPPENDTAVNYEKQRFSRSVLTKSAQYLEKKHGFRVWSAAADKWLSGRHQDLGISEPEPGASVAPVVSSGDERSRIALIVDTDDWAFDHIAQQLVKHLSDQFNFRVLPLDVVETLPRALLMTKDFQLLHFFWRGHLLQLLSGDFKDHCRYLGISTKELLAPSRLSTAVYDHLYLGPADAQTWRTLLSDRVAGYSVSSKRLFRLYSGLTGYPAPKAVLEDGVDTELFAPKRLERFEGVGKRPLRVGWCGNSRWATDERNDSKGVYGILKPVLKELALEGLSIEPLFADRAERVIPHEDMPDYYASLDLYVCTSEIEGTPNPILEAMACGVPVVSTDVGVVPDVFGPAQQRWILDERSPASLKRALRTLASDPGQLAMLSRENLQSIRNWDWRVKVRAFEGFFRQLLAAQGAQSSIGNVANSSNAERRAQIGSVLNKAGV